MRAKIGVFSTILLGALVLGPVYERQPDSFLAYILTVLFAITLLAFAFRVADSVFAQCRIALRYVRGRR